MLKRHSQLLLSGLLACDVLVTCLAWLAAYGLRFHTPFFHLFGNPHIPDLPGYAALLLAIAPAAVLANVNARLYEPRRIGSLAAEFIGILRSTLVIVLVFLALAFFVRTSEDNRFSRTFIMIFAGLNIAGMGVERFAIRRWLRRARAEGRNLRHAYIIGAGRNGQSLASAIRRNAWAGISVKGYLDDRHERLGMDIRGVPVLGAIADLPSRMAADPVDQIYIALPTEHQARAYQLMEHLAETTVDVYMVPDVMSLASLNLDISNFDGLPVLHLRESPLYGWHVLLKRVFDIAFSAAVLLGMAIPMLIIALLIKRDSKGPVFYKQERMGLDGRTFHMLKFRSMRIDAEVQTGAVWARENDPRRTKLGTFLRKYSLDEFPQFINVLLGHMSVVGPRPERPVFIEEFKRTVPKYMLRHKMKAGITGWAQVNGWRGNTSLKKRIQFDIHYIENWSLGFDVYIIFMTVFRGVSQKNAY